MAFACPNDWKKVSLSARSEMAARADFAVERAFQQAARDLQRADPTEPELVRHFFLFGLEEVEQEWNLLLESYKLELVLSGIFVHSTPKVVPQLTASARSNGMKRVGIPTTQRCELGDLLLIVIHEGGTPGSGNGILLQAKKGFKKGADPLQRLLYEHAHRFEYQHSTPALNGQKRQLNPKTDTKLAYWDLLPSVYTVPWPFYSASGVVFAADAALDKYSQQSFGGVLAQLVFGSVGTGFSLPAPGISWSRIISDLVSVTANRILTTGPVNVRGSKRGRKTALVAANLAVDSAKLLVRNSLGKSLRLLSSEFDEAARGLEKAESLKHLVKRHQGSLEPPRPPVPDGEDQPGDGALTTIIVRCGLPT